MSEADHNDLFSKNFNGPEPVTDRFRSFLRGTNDPKFEISLEILAFVLAVLLVLFILVFYMGYSRGRSAEQVAIASKITMFKSNLANSNIKYTHSLNQPQAPIQPVAANSSTDAQTDTVNNIKYADQNNGSVANSSEKPYTIQAVTYRSKAQAEREVTNLQKEGYSCRLITKQSLHVVCVGAYANRTEARRDLASLKKRYSDCFLRKF